jgi:hypothetical protein
MKRFLTIILSAVLLLSMTACSIAQNAEPPEAYVPSQDIEVAVCIVSDEAKVVTRRLSDKELAWFEMICVYFDAEGKQLGEAERIECTFSTQDELSVWSFTAPAGCVYMDATIADVTYKDLTKSTCAGVMTWVDQTVAGFTVDGYEKAMEEMAGKEGAAAEKCDALEYSVEPPEGNTMDLKLKNVSGKEINEVIACLLWFDAQGTPIDMEGVLVDNSEKVSAKTLAVDEDASYTVTAPEGAASAKIIIQDVTFADETNWTNNYVYEWSVANWAAAK